ncbi:HD domain-containing protein [Paenibacillus sp. 481]|uniref:HD domain-containing protein n=1 Tax=Paenibacillus sp. 481 TaxID=2835869 RepID=UPI001E3D4E3E|nr:HD domain-containing protein [Paenibacillus sp. 481]UHA73679.1 HD domain-containing protein [Paenibacillus sp. 481]
MDAKLRSQILFIIEIDKLKQVYRKTKIIGQARLENDAEHSWHLAMMAMILVEYANDPALNLLKVMKMLLIHDLVEIEAGDTYAYDETGRQNKFEREDAAARTIFSLLPAEQYEETYALWLEYEAQQTSEAKYAAAMDRLQPLLINDRNGGELWREHQITSEMVLKRNQDIQSGSEQLWVYAQQVIQESIEQGRLKL